MTQEDAFLEDIRENPKDDTPRLIFADWLEDHTQHERAEFIRIQVELEPSRFEIDRPRVRELLTREEELLDKHKDAWLASPVFAARAVPTRNHNPAIYGPFHRRGVPELVACSLDALLMHGEDLLAFHPTIRELAVFDVEGRCAELANCGLHDRIATLEVADWLCERDTRELLVSPWLSHLDTVRVWYEEALPWRTSPEEWPVGLRIELVEFGGASIGQPGQINEELDELSERFARSGRTLVPIRPFLTRFPLLPDQGQNLHPGRLADGRYVVFGSVRFATDPVLFAYFDEEGNFVDSHDAANPACVNSYEEYSAWLAEEFGYSPCLVWMREFRTPQGFGIRLLPGPAIEFDDTGDLWWWLYQGKYVIDWCNTPWASRRTGEITDT